MAKQAIDFSQLPPRIKLQPIRRLMGAAVSLSIGPISKIVAQMSHLDTNRGGNRAQADKHWPFEHSEKTSDLRIRKWEHMDCFTGLITYRLLMDQGIQKQMQQCLQVWFPATRQRLAEEHQIIWRCLLLSCAVRMGRWSSGFCINRNSCSSLQEQLVE